MKHNIHFVIVKDTVNKKGKRKDTACGKGFAMHLPKMSQYIEYIKDSDKSITKR